MPARHVTLTECKVACERSGLEERLKFPALRPALVIGQVRFERSNECAILPLRTEVRVDLPQSGLDGGSVDTAHHDDGESSGDIDRASGIELGFLGGRDEDHVDVAHVVEFGCARFAHSDHGQAGCRDLLSGKGARSGSADGAPCHGEGGVDSRRSKVRQRSSDILETGGGIILIEVEARDLRESATIPDAQRRPGALIGFRSEAAYRADGIEQIVANSSADGSAATGRASALSSLG